MLLCAYPTEKTHEEGVNPYITPTYPPALLKNTAPLLLTKREFYLDFKEKFLTVDNLEDYKLKINKDGRITWRTLNGKLVNTGKFRFIIDAKNTIYAANIEATAKTETKTTARPRFHHGSLVGESWPLYAGRAKAMDGEICLLNNHSGHFAQSKKYIDAIIKLFEEKGASTAKAKALWYAGFEYNSTHRAGQDIGIPLKYKQFPYHQDLSRHYGIYQNTAPERMTLSPEEYRFCCAASNGAARTAPVPYLPRKIAACQALPGINHGIRVQGE
jgi:hypothetical protein